MDDRGQLTRRELRKRKRRRELLIKSIILVALIVALIVVLWVIFGRGGKPKHDESSGTQTASTSSVSQSSQSTQPTQAPVQTSSSAQGQPSGTSESMQPQNPGEGTGEPAAPGSREAIMAQASAMAVQYDYQGAIDLLYTIEGANTDADVVTMIADYETAKSTLVATSPYYVTHVFFHSLVVDPARGFSITDNESWNNGTVGFCEWMTTVYEFNAILQQMYDRGYVLVSIYDLVDITTDENGVEHITPKDIYLPQGKTPFVMSLDDLCYYHSYDGRGCAIRMIVGEDGKPTCEYVDAEGNPLVGSYDCVPLLDDFLAIHPDFSYKGAKGTIALIGYDGIFGYRTDYCYRDRVELAADQVAWLEVHPEYNWEWECQQATAVANALRADGWTFASHTWGHIRVGDAGMEWIQTDTQKWLEYVAPLIGGTDIIIFAHGQDLAAWNEEYAESEKFKYLKSQGFSLYCNVDSSQYFVQIGDEYLRMGRRNLDGYRIWMAVYGGDDRVSDLFDAASVIDPARPIDPSLYQL